jgi:hypothetical protein
MEWALLLVIGAHVAAAMAHTLIFRDRIMQRMLPEKPMAVLTKNPETEGRADEARPGIASRLVIGIAEPDETAIKPGSRIFCAIW